MERERDTKRRVAAIRYDGSDATRAATGRLTQTRGGGGLYRGLRNVVGREEEEWVGNDSRVKTGQDYC